MGPGLLPGLPGPHVISTWDLGLEPSPPPHKALNAEEKHRWLRHLSVSQSKAPGHPEMWPFPRGLCLPVPAVKGWGTPGAIQPSLGPPGARSPVDTRLDNRGRLVAHLPSRSVSPAFRKPTSRLGHGH